MIADRDTGELSTKSGGPAFTNEKKNRYSPIGGREPTAGNFQPQLVVPQQHHGQSRDQLRAAGEGRS